MVGRFLAIARFEVSQESGYLLSIWDVSGKFNHCRTDQASILKVPEKFRSVHFWYFGSSLHKKTLDWWYEIISQNSCCSVPLLYGTSHSIQRNGLDEC